MSKLSIFGHFLNVGKSQAKTRVVFQAKTQAKILSIELGPRGAHNPTLAGNFPDIFFDMTSSVVGGVNHGILGSLGNSSFPGPSGASSLMDEPPTATTLDLETEEKNFLAELFPPSAQIEQVKVILIQRFYESVKLQCNAP